MPYISNADIIIVGGGPAGLSLAYYLEKKKLDYLVVEKNKIGNSWANMPNNWRVVSPQWTNTLPGTPMPILSLYSKPFVNTYRDYLQKYVEKFSIKILEGIKINNVNVDKPSKFVLESGNKKLECKVLVSATGYFSRPFIPKLQNGNDKSIRFFHVAQYSCPEDLKELYPRCKKILIVGRRVSAGQLMTDLYDSGYSITVSARGPVETRDGSFKGKLKDIIYFPYEEVKIRFKPKINSNSFPNMDGGKTEELLNKEIVEVRQNLMSIDNGFAIFEDGSREQFDLIIFATGYQPALEFLQNIVNIDQSNGLPSTVDMQSSEMSNLFFIGLDQLYNFRSRYLRGIKRDAKMLSNKINNLLDTKLVQIIENNSLNQEYY